MNYRDSRRIVMLTLVDILRIDSKDFADYKIHFATGKNNEPLNEYYLGKFQEFQERQTKPNFNRKYIISPLIHGTNKP